MSGKARTPVVSFLKAALLLSGWGAAAWLGYDHWFSLREQAPVPVVQQVNDATPPATIPDLPAVVAIAQPVELPQPKMVPPPVAAEPQAQEPGMNRTEAAFLAWKDDPALAGALIGFCVLDEKGQEIYTSPLAKTALCPASALKTVTTGAAFGILGPEFRFETTLAGSEEIDKEGVLRGNLVLVGGGDPTLAASDLESLAEALLAKGLKKVTGDLRVDTSVFPVNPMSDHWNWGDIGNAYGAGAFGLNVDHNRLTVRFDAGDDEGKPAKLWEGDAMQKQLRWENLVLTGAEGSGDQVVAYSRPYDAMVTLRGTVPKGAREFEVTVAIPDPGAVALSIVRKRLTDAGVKFLKQNTQEQPERRVTLTSHASAALPEIVDHLHKVSDNLEAQCFFLMMGRQKNADPIEVVRQYWEGAGVSCVGLRLIDGSGLARASMIRPLDLARINLAARNSPHGDRYYQSLNLSRDGFSRGKLGSMSGVKTEVGFLRMPDGRDWTYAVMANGLDTRLNFWRLKDTLLNAVRASGS